MNHIKEKVMEGVFLFTAVISIIAVALICAVSYTHLTLPTTPYV